MSQLGIVVHSFARLNSEAFGFDLNQLNSAVIIGDFNFRCFTVFCDNTDNSVIFCKLVYRTIEEEIMWNSVPVPLVFDLIGKNCQSPAQ